MSLSEGQVLNNRYRVTKLVAESELSALYQVWDQNANILCLLEEIADPSEAARQMFSQQAAQLYNLRQANLPRVLEAFSVSGQGSYLVMQNIEGQDLQALFNQTDGSLDEAEVIPASLQVCDALEYLQNQNPMMVHGDVKPANIILTRQPGAKEVVNTPKAMLIGLGIGTKFDPQSGVIVGARAISPGFSPPESYGKGKIDRQTDIYSLGASLYYLLVGKRLPESVLIKSKDVQPPKAPHEFNSRISQALSAVIMKAIEIDPARRFGSAGEFKGAILGALPAFAPATKPEPARKTGAQQALLIGGILIGLIVLVLLFGTGWLASRYLLARMSTDTPLPPSATFTLPVTSTQPVTASNTPPAATFTATMIPSPTGLPARIEDRRGVPMVLVPAGEFLMGSTYGGAEELPVHTVFLSAFYIDLYEVTNARYEQCVKDGACDLPNKLSSATRPSYYGNSAFDDYPVIMVTWAKAKQYCNWRGANLPTEAQWEKSARGSDGRIFPWIGETANCSLANFWNNEPGCQRDATQVGSYRDGVSIFGLFDMAGNVWEWVADYFDPTYYASSPTNNPNGPGQGGYRVVRGGSFSGGMGQIRVTTRGRNLPNNGYNYVGFRCASPIE